MSYVDQFLASIRKAFTAEGPDGIALAWGLGVLLLLLGGAVGVAALRRRLAQQRAVTAAARACGLSNGDLAWLKTLARSARVDPLRVMHHLSAFEHATALALAEQPPRDEPPPHSCAARIGDLRRTLGFHVLPPHAWLVTTRELANGDRLSCDAGTCQGEIVRVNEASFAVHFERAPELKHDGRPISLALVRWNDAHYALRCRVVSANGSELILAHDEAPERRQKREFVRVRTHNAIVLQALTGATSWEGRLQDISAGGFSAIFPAPVPAATPLLASFRLAGTERFELLAARILSLDPPESGPCLARAAFTELSEHERARLARGITWHELHGPDEPPPPHPLPHAKH